jgi:hypothetical protein
MQWRMWILTIAMSAFAITGFAQGSNQLTDLYQFVENADSLSDKSNTVFYIDKFYSDNTPYKETWRYSTDKGRIVYFEIEYFKDSIAYSEGYYLNRNNLVCSEEYETKNLPLDDVLTWGGIFYYEGGQTEHFVSVGKPAVRDPFDGPEIVARNRFRKRFAELRMHIPMLP